MSDRQPADSTNNPIHVGDRVRFRGQEYTIREFVMRSGCVAQILFVDPQHTEEVADEVSVDLIERQKRGGDGGRAVKDKVNIKVLVFR